MAVKVKVCGMKYPDNIAEVTALGVDYIGFIFYEKSKRYVGTAQREYIRNLVQPAKVGVFVNTDLPELVDTIHNFKLDAVQLHGNETAEFCQALKAETSAIVIKAFGVDHSFDWNQLESYRDVVDYFLFDTKSSAYGGTGIPFDWSLLNQYKLDCPYFLSGGLGPDNIGEALQVDDPRLYALDLNSKFEVEPGLKDINLLTQSINNIKR
ncbi:phosphoribosylanthranilate isomerase [Sphingobacterium thalpophilum]|uniref:phosphoribosylanthranilate isomerase n=1 Tax=Sphingobacterium TaxID=28453 RepID=UPI0022442A6F|nr:phosphoribosylanthranilate isomerase [Sphingobacterium sp. InxBP1]MCW8310634.1 phosphoribosylanthranilate isomerase [Sphingobacterium sp. InxBP1]